jgi:LacI family transcriptional regulator
MSRSSPVRLEDVAREAGVHVSTVSRVLNPRQKVSLSAATRERVLEAAERLKYRPHAFARGLKTASTGTIGLLVPSLRNPMWSEIVHGAFDGAWLQNYVVLLQEDSGDHRAEEAYERLVYEGRIDGMLVLNASPDSGFHDRLLRDSIPTVFANRALPGSGRNVVMDEHAGMRVALDHIAGLGHVLVALVDGDEHVETAVRRIEAAEGIARELGLSLTVFTAPLDEQGGYDAMAEALALDPAPTACIVATVNQVVGAVHAATRRRPDAPPYLVSYDEERLLDFLPVPVTSVVMPLHELGQAAAAALIAQIEDGVAEDVTIATAPTLNVRHA